jgi:hypothetical protein
VSTPGLVSNCAYHYEQARRFGDQSERVIIRDLAGSEPACTYYLMREDKHRRSHRALVLAAAKDGEG